MLQILNATRLHIASQVVGLCDSATCDIEVRLPTHCRPSPEALRAQIVDSPPHAMQFPPRVGPYFHKRA